MGWSECEDEFLLESTHEVVVGWEGDFKEIILLGHGKNDENRAHMGSYQCCFYIVDHMAYQF